MPKTIPALLNPQLLQWARSYAGMNLDYVARETNLDPRQLEKWEAGDAKPSIAQLRELAKAYHFPIAVFYLPSPPSIKARRPPDRRYLHGFGFTDPSPELNFEFRRANERREIAIELKKNLNQLKFASIPKCSLRHSPETIGEEIRKFLGITCDEQFSWKDNRKAFNAWRERLENKDILVFQAISIPLSQMRGFSLFYDELPVVAVNRKDVPNARNFTLLHEFAHLILRKESLCDLREDSGRLNAQDNKIEIFCNKVAAASLVPMDIFLSDNLSIKATSDGDSGEHAIESLSRKFSVSREVVVRRLLTAGLVDEDFYIQKRNIYQNEYKKLKQKKEGGHLSPVVNVVSSVGKYFVGLVLENLGKGTITTGDFSDYLGIRVKHLDGLRETVFRIQ